MSQNEETAFEREMAKKNNSVVYILNISDEPFQHSYGGVPYSLNPGEKMPFPYPVGMLLAKHLAMKLARAEAKKKGKLEGADDRKAVSLYGGAALEPFMSQIIVSTVEQPMQPVKSEAETLRQKTEEMQQTFREKTPPNPEITKNDVIKDLKARGIKFNPRDSKEDLLAILIESEKNGGE